MPTDAEWKQLAQYISDQNGGYSKSGDDWYSVGTHLKTTTGWHNNGNGTDDYGFSGLPGGYRSYNGYFHTVASLGYWWSATESSTSTAWRRNLHYNSPYIYRYLYHSKEYGFSVRLVRD